MKPSSTGFANQNQAVCNRGQAVGTKADLPSLTKPAVRVKGRDSTPERVGYQQSTILENIKTVRALRRFVCSSRRNHQSSASSIQGFRCTLRTNRADWNSQDSG